MDYVLLLSPKKFLENARERLAIIMSNSLFLLNENMCLQTQAFKMLVEEKACVDGSL